MLKHAKSVKYVMAEIWPSEEILSLVQLYEQKQRYSDFLLKIFDGFFIEWQK